MSKILISGISRGIGKELAKKYASLGNEVFGFARGPYTENEGDYKKIKKDAINFSEKDLPDNFRKTIDIMILAHAVFGPIKPSLQIETLDLNNIFKINCSSHFQIIKECQKQLKNSNNPKVIMLISKGGIQTKMKSKGSLCYKISKSAQISLGIVMSEILKDNNISFAMINPGSVNTRIGGINAKFTAYESAKFIFDIVEKLSINQSSYLFNFDGNNLPL